MTSINSNSNYNNSNKNRYFSTIIDNKSNKNNSFFKNYINKTKNLNFKEKRNFIESFILDSQDNQIKDKIYNDINLVSKQAISSDILESFIKIRDDLERYTIEAMSSQSTTPTTTTTTTNQLLEGLSQFDLVLGELIKENLKNNDKLFVRELSIKDMDESIWRSIIENEAVHPYRNLEEPIQEILNRTTENRTCLVLFHPRLPSLPLMSLYIAFTSGIPDNIPSIESNDKSLKENNPNNIDSAIFYSISSLHKGLGGVSLGHILITKAVEYIKLNKPEIKHFCTLSPLPRFKKYLSKNHSHIINKIQNKDSVEEMKNHLQELALNYIYKEKSKINRVYDPVCNFHLKNGAMIYRLNWNADNSSKRYDESFGIMINYYYDINNLHQNSKEYSENGSIVTHSIFNNQFKNSKF